MAMVALAPSDVNPDRIPNEDSSNLEFDDFNLFETNRFPGYDRIEGGQRVTYGLRGAIYGLDGGKVEAFLGQRVRHGDDDDFAAGSGPDRPRSDTVGRRTDSPTDLVDVLHGFPAHQDPRPE